MTVIAIDITMQIKLKRYIHHSYGETDSFSTNHLLHLQSIAIFIQHEKNALPFLGFQKRCK